MAAAVLTAGFSSCSNDEGDGPGMGEEAMVKITIPTPQTYADANATANETRFNTADIFVYNGGTLETHKPLSASDFTQGTNGWEMTTPIVIQSGSKNIYVGLNLTAADVTAVQSGLYAPYTVGSNYAAIKSIIEATNTKGNAMFSVNDPTNNTFAITTGAVNSIQVKVERWAAKVTTRVSSTINPGIPSAAIGSFSFAMGNVNTQMYPFQKLLSSGVVEDPNWDWTGKSPADFLADSKVAFVNEFGGNYPNINASAYTPVDAENTGVTNRQVKYVTENTTKEPKQGDVTYVSVRAEFTPNAYHTYDGSNISVVTSPGSVPANLYVVETATGEVYYFQNQTEADDYALAINSKVGHYRDGLCYYFIWLDPNKGTSPASPANVYGSIRNFFYDTKITKVNSLGYPDPEEPDPNKPLPKDSELEVEILIQDWVPVTLDSELGKI